MNYKDRKGNFLTVNQYADTIRQDDGLYKVVARSYDLPHDQMVSTVWLGLEHAGGVFETMVFGGPGDQETMIRYRTEIEALEGHLELVRWLRDFNDPLDFERFQDEGEAD